MNYYHTWGATGIDENTIEQMDNAMNLPVTVAGALMPDAHLGYGLPIGGVLACDNAVIPYAVGVDIACRMKLTVLHLPASDLPLEKQRFIDVLEQETHFGIGVENPDRPDHEVLYEDWNITDITREQYAKASLQLGTSGSGNHFVEFGEVDGQVAIMSHSGSRGPGAAVCNYYSKLAKAERPEYGELAWLDMDDSLGQEYWAAMELMGKYAAANHDCIHNAIMKSLDADALWWVENHHNFAWKEEHEGREVIVHRKGATPAGFGVKGIIPGSMGTPAFIVRGKGNPYSLCSSSHGAGRLMSRKQAKATFDYGTEIAKLNGRGITVLSAGADEVCGVYKDIHEVMAAQKDLVEIVNRFNPEIVKMAPAKKKHWEK